MFNQTRKAIIELADTILKFAQHISSVVNNHKDTLDEIHTRLGKIENHLALIEARRLDELEKRREN